MSKPLPIPIRSQAARTLLSNVEHAMESFQVDLESACKGLGTTVETYRAAKELLE